MEELVLCYNKGCGQKFSPKDNKHGKSRNDSLWNVYSNGHAHGCVTDAVATKDDLGEDTSLGQRLGEIARN